MGWGPFWGVSTCGCWRIGPYIIWGAPIRGNYHARSPIPVDSSWGTLKSTRMKTLACVSMCSLLVKAQAGLLWRNLKNLALTVQGPKPSYYNISGIWALKHYYLGKGWGL